MKIYNLLEIRNDEAWGSHADMEWNTMPRTNYFPLN